VTLIICEIFRKSIRLIIFTMIGKDMTLTVIATLHPRDGLRDEVLAAALTAVPQVLAENGCLSYEPHTVGRDGLIIVESWASSDALKAHGSGPVLANFQTSVEGLVTAPSDVLVARPAERPMTD